jgi:hypothetical protein
MRITTRAIFDTPIIEDGFCCLNPQLPPALLFARGVCNISARQDFLVTSPKYQAFSEKITGEISNSLLYPISQNLVECRARALSWAQ